MPKDKFKTNPFAKKYKEELTATRDTPSTFYKKYEEDLEQSGFVDEILENADQVKSWKRSPISQTVNLTYIFLAFIIGFSLCAVVMTPIVINSI